MNIAIVSSALLGHGGMETVIGKVLKFYDNKENMDLSLILTDGVKDKSWISHFDTDHVFYHEHSNRLNEFIFLSKLLRKENFDIVIATSKKTIIFCSWIRNVFHLNYTIVSWIHFSLTEDGMPINLKKYGDYHIAISSKNRNLIEKMGVSKKKIFLLYNPVSLAEKKIAISKSKKKSLIYVGRIEFQGQKNLKELIDFVSDCSNITKIDIFGSGQTQQCQEYIKDKYPENASKFVWHGWCKNPWEEIETTSGLVLTSTMEGFPMVLIEAMSRGIPCISSNCPTGPDDIIIPNINGELYELHNKRDFQKKINKFLSIQFNQDEIIKSVQKFSDKEYFNKLSQVLMFIYKKDEKIGKEKTV